MNTPTELITILKALRDNDIKSLIVGGSVRDYLLGLAPKDFDVGCCHTTYAKLNEVLEHFSKVDVVGKGIGVAILEPILHRNVISQRQRMRKSYFIRLILGIAILATLLFFAFHQAR